MAAVRIALMILALFASHGHAAQPAQNAIAAVRLGEFEVVFAQTRLSQLREAVGAGLVDRHAGLLWLCYTAVGEGAAQRVWLTATDGLEADSFTAEILPEDERPSPACPALPGRFMPLSMASGIWLGMTLDDMERKIGAKAERSGVYFVFAGAGHSRRTVVQLLDNRAVRLWVHNPAAR